MHTEWTNFVSAVADIPRGAYYRHNIAGDLPTVDRSIVIAFPAHGTRSGKADLVSIGRKGR